MSNRESFDRRQKQRRHALPKTGGRANDNCPTPANASGLSLFAPLAPPHQEHRTNHDRRLGERRTHKLGPPQGMEERRFRPDLRGVVFPLYYNTK